MAGVKYRYLQHVHVCIMWKGIYINPYPVGVYTNDIWAWDVKDLDWKRLCPSMSQIVTGAKNY